MTVGNSPKFTQFTPDDFATESAPPRTTLSRYTKGITPFANCIRPFRFDLNDGVFHTQLRRYVHKPCYRSDCPRHWLRYALSKYHQLTGTLPIRSNWYHVRLACPKRLTPADRPPAIRTWMNRVREAVPDVYLAAVVHRGRLTDHYHVLMGSEENTVRPPFGRLAGR